MEQIIAYDEGLAQRVREKLLETNVDFEEIKMFGGIGFMVGGNVACGLTGDDLMVRVGPEGNDSALAQPGARPFDFTGKPMKGWIYVSQDHLDDEAMLNEWVQLGVTFAKSLPPK